MVQKHSAFGAALTPETMPESFPLTDVYTVNVPVEGVRQESATGKGVGALQGSMNFESVVGGNFLASMHAMKSTDSQSKRSWVPAGGMYSLFFRAEEIKPRGSSDSKADLTTPRSVAVVRVAYLSRTA